MKTTYFGNRCKRGHVGKRYIKTRSCVECNRLRNLVANKPQESLLSFRKTRNAYRKAKRLTRVESENDRDLRRKKQKEYQAQFELRHPGAIKERAAKWRRLNPDRVALQALKKYRLCLNEFDNLLVAQIGKCAGCGYLLSERRQINVDHDHKTGLVRGLLCRPCNLALGQAKDDSSRLRGLAAYLDSHALPRGDESRRAA